MVGGGVAGWMEPGQHAFMRPATRDWRRRTILLGLRGRVSPERRTPEDPSRSLPNPGARVGPGTKNARGRGLARGPLAADARRQARPPLEIGALRNRPPSQGRAAGPRPVDALEAEGSRAHRSCCRVVDARILDARARQRGQRRGGRGAGAQRRSVRCLLQICASARGRAARRRRRRRAERADGGRGGGRSPQPRAPAARQIGRGGGGRGRVRARRNRSDELRVTFTRTSVALDGGAPLRLPLPRPVGTVANSYCDDDLRVSRGGRGGVFVLRRLARDLNDR